MREEIMEGYENKYVFHIGEKDYLYAISKDKNKQAYLQCEIESVNGMLVCRGFTSDDYLETLEALGENIQLACKTLRREYEEKGVTEIRNIEEGIIERVERSQSIVGCVVALDEDFLEEGNKDCVHQLFYVDGGFGAMGDKKGNACFCYNLYSGERTRIERFEIKGIVKEENLPAFAKDTLKEIKERWKNNEKEQEYESEKIPEEER